MIRIVTAPFGIAAIALAVGVGAQTRFSVTSDLAVLHVAVTDDHGRYVSGLSRDAFSVIEGGVAQPIAVFSGDDTPAAVGLLIDDSTSMAPLRTQVTSAVAAFLDTSHPSDELFALTFNEQVLPVLPPHIPLTQEPALLRSALQHAVVARGRTALHDAVMSGLDGLGKATQSRTALVIVSDGGDNASQHSPADVLEALTVTNTVVYAVALPNPVDLDANPRFLNRLARTSGGLCFSPRDAKRLLAAMVAIARDIRSTYTLAYPVPSGEPGMRHVRVDVRRNGLPLHARVRGDYLVR